MKSTLLKVIGTVAIINIFARLLGFFRELLIGYQYGTSKTADLIITAYTVPNFLYIVLGGAITTAFISIYLSKKDSSLVFLRESFSFVLIISLIITIISYVMTILFSGVLLGDSSSKEIAEFQKLLTWMMPSVFFLIFSTWLNGLHNSHKRFSISTLSSLIYNFVFLLIAILFQNRFGSIVYGVGALIAAVIMLVFLFFKADEIKSFKLSFSFLKSKDIKRMTYLAIPIIFGGATVQFYFLIQRYYSLKLDDGIVASINYAAKMTQFPQAILMTAVTTVLFPIITRSIRDQELDLVNQLFSKGIKLLSLLLIPMAAYFMFNSEDILRLIMEYGNFTSEDTARTAPLLKIFSFTLFLLSINMYVSRFFYAFENSIMPVVINVSCVFIVNIVIIEFFIDQYGANAIAWATVLSSLIQAVLLIIFAKIQYGLTLELISVKEILFIVFVLSVLWISHGFINHAIVSGIVFVLTYLVGMFLFKIRFKTYLT